MYPKSSRELKTSIMCRLLTLYTFQRKLSSDKLYANDLLKIDNFSIRKHEKGIVCEASLGKAATGCSIVALKFIF